MENYEIADKFKLLSQLMELHNENSFKIRSYQNASFKIDKMNDVKLMECDLPTLEQMDGIGKSVASKIAELQQTGTINEIEKLQAVTPQGVLHMMKIKGIGPKKVAVLWKELEVETLGELLYACNEN
ncbi:MAG TPA: DNA polymerase/3'-5' exonuclease PolX, partial [Bacteroidia bacterium]|nr:DNA polymerase/3'-5' exonuclease PolX [Bacteroidia bacterium]